jgi:hypothetical protein
MLATTASCGKADEKEGGFLTFTLDSYNCAENDPDTYLATLGFTIENIAADPAKAVEVVIDFYGVPRDDPTHAESGVCHRYEDLGDLEPKAKRSATSTCVHSVCPESYGYYFTGHSGASGGGDL